MRRAAAPLIVALLAALMATGAAPALTPAGAQDLQRMLSGHTLQEAHQRTAGAGPEAFCADGRWTEQIERVRRSGRWRVEDGRICIDMGDRFPNCRHAFLDPSGALWLAPDGAQAAARAYVVGRGDEIACAAGQGSP